MARAPWCSEDIYDAADEFRERCLRMDGSLFTDRRVWTVEGLQSIDARVALPDVGTGSWLDKLEAQLEALTRHARGWTLHLPARWPWHGDYINALNRIRALPAAA
jgi:hypothetical protein